MDISGFFSWFLGQYSRLVSWSFNTLDSIKFSGISLLEFNIVLILLGVLVPLLINLVRSSNRQAAREARKNKKG